jgi:hypothetical protein
MAASERHLTPTTIQASGRPGLARTVLSSYALLWAGTLLAALLVLPFGGALQGLLGLRLAPASPGNPRVAAVIAANNLREAAIPFLCALLRLQGRHLRRVGDAVVGGCLAGNTVLAGSALAAYGPGLLWYLPHWPLEWAALALALTAWRRARHGQRDPVELLLLALACGAVLCTAALIETYTVPGG